MDNTWTAALAAFATSLVPLLELRAGIPVGLAMGLSPEAATAAAVAGNVLQIPVARVLVDRGYQEAGRFPKIQRWLEKTESQVMRYKPMIRRWGWLGLIAFVMLPMPGTGVWGGAVLARLLLLPVSSLWLGVGFGLGISGVLLTLSILGVISLFQG